MLYFDLNEINILIQNMKSGEVSELVDTLYLLKVNTADPILKDSIDSLMQEILKCLPGDICKLYAAVTDGKIASFEGFVLG